MQFLNNEAKFPIIDGDFMLYSFTSPKKIVDTHDNVLYLPRTLGEVLYNIEVTLENFVRLGGTSNYIGFLGSSGSNFRYDIYPEYKGNRANREKPLYFKEIKDYLVEQFNFHIVRNIEADDAVRITYNQYIGSAYMVSPDKDVYNLTGLHLHPKKLNFNTVSYNQAIEYFWTSMLVGDSADNIKGVPLIGPKKASILLQNCKSENDFKEVVLEAYITKFGKTEGLDEYHKNYNCLKILDELEEFNIPDPSVIKLY